MHIIIERGPWLKKPHSATVFSVIVIAVLLVFAFVVAVPLVDSVMALLVVDEPVSEEQPPAIVKTFDIPGIGRSGDFHVIQIDGHRWMFFSAINKAALVHHPDCPCGKAH